MAHVGIRRGLQYFRAQDLIWMLLFSGLAVVSPTRYPEELWILSALAILQLVETRIPALASRGGNLAAIFLKLFLGYLLIGYTYGINSSYYLILLLPVVSAATTLGLRGTLLFVLLACGTYASFLLYVDWRQWAITARDWREFSLRLAFLAVVGFLTNRLAEANRVEARKYQIAAQQLADANISLQKAEAAVRRTERLAALGQLSAGLAHELRNPLGTIRASAEMLMKNVPPDREVARELAGFISTEVDRTNSLVGRFLEFARPLELRLQPADVGELIDRAVARFERDAANNGVTVYRNYSPDIAPAPLDVELMERVFYNLLLNAAQASPAGGAITVKTRATDGGVEISVIDRGSGIDPKDRESIFNPFFTTKPDGVGLGLAIVSKIVDEHGGRIAVESEVDKGSVFRVYLPAGEKS
jgi:signal transduction histidine kinase